MPVILDGATATELQRRGRSICAPLWSSAALLSKEGQAATLAVHQDYIEAGADIITTNTFRTNCASVIASGLDAQPSSLVETAVALAHQAITNVAVPGRRIYVAGSLAPLGDAYKPGQAPTSTEMQDDHGMSIDHLRAAGVDFILAETMNNWREAWIIGRLCKQKNVPFIISFVCDDKGFLLSGENYADMPNFVNECKPLTVAINCSTLQPVMHALDRLSKLTEVPLGTYPNIEDRSELPSTEEGHAHVKTNISLQQFSEFMAESTNRYGLSLLGGCCGTTPKYIRVLRTLVDTGRL